jgi:hypothetical protein
LPANIRPEVKCPTVASTQDPITTLKTFIVQTPGPNVIKLFTVVIYHHPMVIPSFCVIKLYYCGNYCGMEVYYCGILTLEKVGLKLPQ